eukprot:55128-Eustigmatos_ZCMA.PRE.1
MGGKVLKTVHDFTVCGRACRVASTAVASIGAVMEETRTETESLRSECKVQALNLGRRFPRSSAMFTYLSDCTEPTAQHLGAYFLREQPMQSTNLVSENRTYMPNLRVPA